MVTTSLRGTLLMGVGLLLSGAVGGAELPGKWVLSIENPEHAVVATLEVTFTDKPAPSCMAGEWKVMKVVSATTRDKRFFPTSEPLSYRMDGNRLTMGRNELCDGYLWLQGPLEGSAVSGEYVSLGLGESTPLGYFTLSQSR